MSPGNQATVRDFLRERSRKAQVGQQRNYATILAQLDQHSNATPWRDLTPEQVRTWVDSVAQRLSAQTTEWYTHLVGAFIKFVHDPDELPKARKYPKGFARALDVGVNHDEVKRKRIPEEHFLGLLDASRSSLVQQALLWTLWDSGFRISAVRWPKASRPVALLGGARPRPPALPGLFESPTGPTLFSAASPVEPISITERSTPSFMVVRGPASPNVLRLSPAGSPMRPTSDRMYGRDNWTSHQWRPQEQKPSDRVSFGGQNHPQTNQT